MSRKNRSPRQEVTALGSVSVEGRGRKRRVVAPAATVVEGDDTRSASLELVGLYPYRFDRNQYGLPPITSWKTYRGKKLFKGSPRRVEDPETEAYNNHGVWRER